MRALTSTGSFVPDDLNLRTSTECQPEKLSLCGHHLHLLGPPLHPHHVLLGDVALHIAVGVLVLEELAEGGVLRVAVQRHHVLVVAAQLGQCHAVRLPGGHLERGGGDDAQSGLAIAS